MKLKMKIKILMSKYLENNVIISVSVIISLVKDLFEENQNKSDMFAKYLNGLLIDLRNFINSTEILGNENLKKVNITEKTLDFNKQRKG